MNHIRLLFAALWALVLGCGLAPSAALQGVPDSVPSIERASAVQGVPEPRLFTIDLPAGDVGTISVDWDNLHEGETVYHSRDWLSKGYQGVRFVGRGVNATHLRPSGWGGAFYAKQHPGIVRLESMTIHAGHKYAVILGEQNDPPAQAARGRAVTPEFMGWLRDCLVVADPPKRTGVRQGQVAPHGGTLFGADGAVVGNLQPQSLIPHDGTLVDSRTQWLVFGNQVDFVAQKTKFVGKEAREHDFYGHGFSRFGALFEDCQFPSAGAQAIKFRPDVTETAAVEGTRIVILRCTFADWYQDWSDRGGTAIVSENGTSDIRIEFCSFRPARQDQRERLEWNALSHCIEIASCADTYFIQDESGAKYGNGHVTIRSCAMRGRSDFLWSNPIVRVARNSGSWLAAQSFEMTGCGVWGGGNGGNVFLMLGEIPAGKSRVSGCNTPAIRDSCRKLGFDVSAEAVWPGPQRLVPLSEGLVR